MVKACIKKVCKYYYFFGYMKMFWRKQNNVPNNLYKQMKREHQIMR